MVFMQVTFSPRMTLINMKDDWNIFDRFCEIHLTVYESYLAYLQSPAVRPHIPVGEHIHELDKFGNHRIESVGWKHKHMSISDSPLLTNHFMCRS